MDITRLLDLEGSFLGHAKPVTFPNNVDMLGRGDDAREAIDSWSKAMDCESASMASAALGWRRSRVGVTTSQQQGCRQQSAEHGGHRLGGEDASLPAGAQGNNIVCDPGGAGVKDIDQGHYRAFVESGRSHCFQDVGRFAALGDRDHQRLGFRNGTISPNSEAGQRGPGRCPAR